MKKLLAAWLCVAIVACAASPKQATMAPQRPEPNTSGGAAPQMVTGDSHAEIEQLSADIEAQRVKMNLPAPQVEGTPNPAEPMSAHTAVQAPPSKPHTEDPTCRPAASQTCTDSCTLSDSICSNKNRICTLADGMPGDTWAAGKCATAQQTCDDAHKRCCACS